jgi:hypothetical protein
MLRRSVPAVMFLVLALLCPALLRAQSTNATITGFVTDPQKALVAGAKVTVINMDTNLRYMSTTNDEGSYTVANLPPGNYKIEVEKQGFKSIVKPDVVLHVQDAVALNFGMAIGSASESVTVTGGAPLINTESAAVSTVVDRQFAENLPMNGRSFQTLIQLTPGVVLTTSNSMDNGQFSINGQRATSNYWMVDGVSANIGVGVTVGGTAGNGLSGAVGSFSAQGGTNSLVSVDALQEFRILTSTYAPEFGRTPGGQISILTRSGTNQFHGTLFDYLRNDVLDANDWFANSAALPKPRERQNDFGGTFSGPILKDRTFYFFSYEGLRLRLPQTALTTVPCDSTCTVFGNARAMAVPAMQPFLNAYPLPNGPEVLTPSQTSTGTAQFNSTFSNSSTLDAYGLRIDHKLNNKWNLFGRYNYSPSEIVQRGGGLFSLGTVSPSRITTQTATVGGTWVISSAATNDLRFNYSRVNSDGSSHLDGFGGAVPLTSLPFPSPFTSDDGALGMRIFSLKHPFLFDGINGRYIQRQFNIVDNFSLQKGSHALKFGVDFRRLSPIHDARLYVQEPLFLNVSSAEKGNLLASIVISGRNETLLFRNLGLFAQDTWRVIPRLTVTYGLRWDVDFAPSTIDGPSLPAVTGFNVNDLSQLALAPTGTPPFKTPYGNVAPRVGVAYQLFQSQDWPTVIRGGFGVFYDLATSEAGNAIFSQQFPFGAESINRGGTFPLSPATAAPPPISSASLSSGILAAFDPNMKLPYTFQWNVALEQGFGRQQTIGASYVGSAGRRLIQSVFLQTTTNPNFGSLYLVTNAGTSDYGALQLQFQRRLSRGLQAIASYTWSHSIDTASAGSVAVGSNALVPSTIASANRGPSDFDIRHVFSTGVTYDIPAPKTNVFARVILGGWSLQNVIQARSAPPVDVFNSLFFELSNGASTNVRPDLIQGPALYLFGPQYPGRKAINNTPGAVAAGCPDGSQSIGPFCPPPTDASGNPLRQGDLPRNFLRGFAATQWDLAVHRNFPIRESLKLQFRAEMFNVLNHPNFGQPIGDISDPSFGQSTQMLGQSLNANNLGAGALSPLYQIGGPRSIQFALKLQF